MSEVRLISLSNPVITIDNKVPTAEEIIIYCARVSSPKNQENLDTAPKLLKYCIKNGHWSIFEMVSLCMEVVTSRAISAQILRHRSFSFQEFCIAGDSKITILQPNGTPHYITIEELYKKQNWKKYKNITVRIYDEEKKQFAAAKIVEVFKTGKKECFKVFLKDGKKIVCTKEHKFLTEDGFLSLEEAVGLGIIGKTVVMTNPKKMAVNDNTLVPRFIGIERIEYVGYIDTYDMQVDHISHNYVANKIVVHNSQRYAQTDTAEIYDARRQDLKNRQNSIDDFDDAIKDWFYDAQNKVHETSFDLYNQALDKGIAKETARFLLPMSSTTRLYMNGSIRSWITYFMVRAEKGTQLEHREIVLKEMQIFKEYFPNIFAALQEYRSDIFQ